MLLLLLLAPRSPGNWPDLTESHPALQSPGRYSEGRCPGRGGATARPANQNTRPALTSTGHIKSASACPCHQNYKIPTLLDRFSLISLTAGGEAWIKCLATTTPLPKRLQLCEQSEVWWELSHAPLYDGIMLLLHSSACPDLAALPGNFLQI